MTQTRNPAVSIGISFFGETPGFELAIKSVFAQTFDDWELILLHDGGATGDLRLAEQISDPRVRVVADDTNEGLAPRLNQIASESRAETLVRMDADDVMLPDRIKLQHEYLTQHPEVDLVVSPAYVLDEWNKVLGIIGTVPIDEHGKALFGNGAIVHPTVAARKSWFLANPYSNEFGLAEDRELWLRTVATSRFEKLPEPLLFYRLVGDFDLRKYRDQRHQDRQLLRRYGGSILNPLAIASRMVSSYTKEGIYVAASALNQQRHAHRFIASRMAAGMDASKRLEAEKVISLVTATEIPGWV